MLHRSAGFTLIEVAAALVLLGILFGTVAVVYSKVVGSLSDVRYRERAAAVAQRHLELLLASMQEPNSIDRSGPDELDPMFQWKLKLSREFIPGSLTKWDLNFTVINATVEVTPAEEAGYHAEPLTLTRYLAWLKPIPGQLIAVPLEPQAEEDPEWLIELRRKLGREPTIDEIIQNLVDSGDMPPEAGAALKEAGEAGKETQ